jgi:hypothetical protein
VDGYLSNLLDAHNAETTIHWLEGLHDQFTQWEWRGGVHGSFSLEDVIAEVKRISVNSDRPITRVSPDSKLAMLMAFQFAGANIPDTFISPLRDIAKKTSSRVYETTITPAAIAAIDILSDETVKKRRGISARRATLLLSFALGGIAGGWVLLRSPNSELSVSIPLPQGELFNSFIPGETVNDTSVAIQATPTPLPEDFQESFPVTIPFVSELRMFNDLAYQLWGFDFANKNTAITIVWSSPELRVRNDGEAPTLTMFPNPQRDGSRFGTQCVVGTGLDCSYANERGVLIGMHSSSPGGNALSFENFRHFLEGGGRSGIGHRWNTEEREQRWSLLEAESALIVRGDHVAQAQSVTVRLSPQETDRIYAEWRNASNDPLDVALEAALGVDPQLGTKINLDERFMVIASCGWKWTGEAIAPSNQPYYQTNIYLEFIAEPASIASP